MAYKGKEVFVLKRFDDTAIIEIISTGEMLEIGLEYLELA